MDDIILKVEDQESITLQVADGGASGTSNYEDLTNKPKINNITLSGNKTGSDLGLASSSDIPTKTSDLTNDSDFITSSYHDSTKQDTLISGTNIKTINSQSLLGSGNIVIEGGGSVTSVNGKTGVVVLDADDVGALPSSTSIPTKTSDLTNDSGYITSDDVPTKTSDLTNDSGFITSSALSPYATQTDLQQGLATKMTIGSVSGNHDGTNWTSISIEGTTKNIPSVSDGAVRYDQAQSLTDAQKQQARSNINVGTEIGNRTRKNITTNLTNLSTAISEQNLEKYGYSIGDYFIGASGYKYYLADMDCNYGGYDNKAVVSTHHCGIVVDTGSSCQWLSSGSATNYSSSTLHSFLEGTVLTNIKSDITALFGDWSSHLIARTEIDNAIGGWGTTWTGLANCLICAMTEVQMYGARIFGVDGYQTGAGSKQLELFRKFRFNEIYGNTAIWLKSLYASSHACHASNGGAVGVDSLSASCRASGLILFK